MEVMYLLQINYEKFLQIFLELKGNFGKIVNNFREILRKEFLSYYEVRQKFWKVFENLHIISTYEYEIILKRFRKNLKVWV